MTYNSRWSSDFGLYKYNDLKKESATTKFIVTITVIGIVLFAVFYLAIFLLRNNEETKLIIINETTNETSTELVSTESTNSTNIPLKLISGEAINELLVQNKLPPRPFVNNVRGPIPASFLPLPSDKPMYAPSFPQLQNYARPGYPRNIQDIINYITPENYHINKIIPTNTNEDFEYKNKDEFIDMPNKQTRFLQSDGSKITFRNPLRPPIPKQNSFGFNDPFYSYKPKDPSDINLLATANLRFAPPIWKDIKSNQITSQTILKSYEKPFETQFDLPRKRGTKPLTLTLNVFPMANDVNKQNFFGFASNSRQRFIQGVDPIERSRRMQPRKMIIHLNVFPDENDFERSDEEIERRLIDTNLEGLKDMLVPSNDNLKKKIDT